MIPNETLQHVQTSGTARQDVATFDISNATKARILVSLSDKMYTRKELAVIREYSNNAADAHIVSNKSISEVVISLPTYENLTFRVRDFGTGLTLDQIRSVYCILGESTKRNSPDQNGVLGYGCKAGFAHADSFTVTSWINGEKTIYNCIKGDSTKLHSVIELVRMPSDEPSGMEICVPVKQSSLTTFHSEAANFFKYWLELPTIENLDSESTAKMTTFRNTPAVLTGEGWSVRKTIDGSAAGAAYMGGVAYRIDWDFLFNRMTLNSQNRVLFDLLRKNNVTFYFKMGEVQFVDSREGLEYTDLTLKSLISRIEQIFGEIQKSLQSRISEATNLWEAKIIYNGLFALGSLGVTEDDNSDAIEQIKFLDGNMIALENAFLTPFTWNGIPIKSHKFHDIHRFDNLSPSTIKDANICPVYPVMTTYHAKKKRAKVRRCNNEKFNTILASPQVAVIINDTGRKSSQSVLARYLMFKPESTVKCVHVLNFVDATIKNNFYNEYNFHSVPVISASEIMNDAKTWMGVTKKVRNNSEKVCTVRYLDVEDGAVRTEEMSIRDIEEGGLFVVESEPMRRSEYQIKNRQIKSFLVGRIIYPSDAVEQLQIISNHTGMEFDKIYIISPKQMDTKWFAKANAAGDWINVWDYVNENLVVNIDVLLETIEMDKINPVHLFTKTNLPAKIMDRNSPIMEIFKFKHHPEHKDNLKLISALKALWMWDKIRGDKISNYIVKDPSEKLQERYPLLSISSLIGEYNDSESLESAAKYINIVDIYEKLVANDLLSAVLNSSDVNIDFAQPVLEMAS